MMLLRAVASLAAVLIGSIGAGEMAWAQYYPPYSPQPQYSVPPYRAVPPPEWDDDDGPVGSLPGGYDRPAPLRPPLPTGRAPYEPYGAVTGSVPYGTREMPGTVERDPYGLPPPGVDPYQLRPPGQRVTPGQPEYGYGPPTIRPPADVGSGQQQQTIAALPPEVQPESGEIKELPPQLRRQIVDYQTREPAGTITIDTANTYLYLVLGNGKAMRYGIGVGREGFTWSGTQRIARMAEWPDWIPPQEMIERQPYLPRFMAGGPGNPLGARAFYLGNTLYRIHGTNQPSTIGQFVSSGCIRLVNEDVEDLYRRVTVGTRVVVLPGGPKPATASATDGRPPMQLR